MAFNDSVYYRTSKINELNVRLAKHQEALKQYYCSLGVAMPAAESITLMTKTYTAAYKATQVNFMPCQQFNTYLSLITRGLSLNEW